MGLEEAPDCHELVCTPCKSQSPKEGPEGRKDETGGTEIIKLWNEAWKAVRYGEAVTTHIK